MDTVTGQQKTEFVLVPRIPTGAMIEAAWESALAENASGVWESMIEEFEKQESGIHQAAKESVRECETG